MDVDKLFPSRKSLDTKHTIEFSHRGKTWQKRKTQAEGTCALLLGILRAPCYINVLVSMWLFIKLRVLPKFKFSLNLEQHTLRPPASPCQPPSPPCSFLCISKVTHLIPPLRTKNRICQKSKSHLLCFSIDDQLLKKWAMTINQLWNTIMMTNDFFEGKRYGWPIFPLCAWRSRKLGKAGMCRSSTLGKSYKLKYLDG